MFKRLLKNLKKPIHYKDEYIEILRRVNPGMLHYGNIELFRIALRDINSNNPVLEIGTFCGLSSNLIAYFLKINNRNNAIVTTDKWKHAETKGIIGQTNLQYMDINEYVRETRKRNFQFFQLGEMPYSLTATSDDFFVKWKNNEVVYDLFEREYKLGGSFCFVYIDGNHSYEFAKRDFENSDLYLELGGYILLDDSADFSDWEVNRLAKEIVKNDKYILIKKNPNYLFKKVKS